MKVYNSKFVKVGVSVLRSIIIYIIIFDRLPFVIPMKSFIEAGIPACYSIYVIFLRESENRVFFRLLV